VDITVQEDKVHGTSAAIRIIAAQGADAGQIKTKVAELLARYTVHYELIIE